MVNLLLLPKSFTFTTAQPNMKTHERIILGCFTAFVALLTWGASVGPVPTYTPYSIRLLTNSSATSMQTYLGVPPTTNTTLLTGTYASGIRLLWISPTNIYIPSLTVASDLTNNGDFANGTYIAKFQCPRLLGSNSMLMVSYTAPKTNANLTLGSLSYFVGTNTNFVIAANGWTTSIGHGALTLTGYLFQNAGDFAQQTQGNLGNITVYGVTSFVDTSSEFTVYVSASTVTSFTNAFMYGLRFYEVYGP